MRLVAARAQKVALKLEYMLLSKSRERVRDLTS